MIFDYFDMLSGEAVYYDRVGHLRSPRLNEIKPTTGIGVKGYSLYLNALSWEKDHVLKYMKCMEYRGTEKLAREELTAFDVITLIPQMRELYRGVLSFFMLEELIWDAKERKFFSFLNEEDSAPIGEITRDNFEAVRSAILQMNYIGLDKSDVPITHTSERSKELWETAQAYLKKQASQSSDDGKSEYKLSNIVSKVCVVHPSYNFLNVFDLTVFQLYDAFFQLNYLRGANLSEQIFSNHGGDSFHFDDWLKPIQTNI